MRRVPLRSRVLQFENELERPSLVATTTQHTSRFDLPPEVEPKAVALFARRLRSYRRKVNRQIRALMVLQGIAATLVALAWSRDWLPGAENQVAPGLVGWAALGSLACLAPALFWIRWRPNGAETRYVVASCQLAFSLLLIQLTGARVETQFLVFISMSFLAFYVDPGVLVAAAALYSAGLLGLTEALGIPSFGPHPQGNHPGWERLTWVVFQAVVVGLAGQRGRLELWLGARHSAALEHTKDGVEELVEQRTAELIENQTRLQRTLDDLETKNAEIECARAEAVRAGEAREQFLANMGHELRTPLNAVLGFAALAKTDELPEHESDCLDEVVLAGRTLMHKLENILALVRLDSDEHEPCPDPISPSALATHLSERYERLLQAADCELETHLDVRDMHISKGARDLQKALGYLLQNAAEHAAGAPVELRFRPSPDDSDRMTIEVVDHGPGLDGDLLETVFEPFRQSDDSDTRLAQGIGVGLSLARRLLATLDATVELCAAPEGGLIARVEVPAQPGDLANEQLVTSEAPEDDSPLSVLLVEDNPVNQRLVQAALKRGGIHCALAADGAQAVEAFEEGRFDLVLMDVQMPIMDGLEATRRIRAHERVERVPILALTARDTTADVRACFEVGMDGHLGKPCSPTRLVEAVRSSARGRRTSPHRAA